jgi:hypothetical protein
MSDYSVAAGLGCSYIRGNPVVATLNGREVVLGRFQNGDGSKVVYVGWAGRSRVVLTPEQLAALPHQQIG